MQFPAREAPCSCSAASAFRGDGRSVIGSGMTVPFHQRFRALAKERSPLCVGIDPSAEAVAGWGLTDDAAGLRTFCERLVDTCAPLVAAMKPQAAFFERQGPEAMAVLRDTVAAAKAHGTLVIIDAKPGDI